MAELQRAWVPHVLVRFVGKHPSVQQKSQPAAAVHLVAAGDGVKAVSGDTLTTEGWVQMPGQTAGG